MSIHLYTKIWANMRTCYCNGVTSDPPGPAAVARPGLGAGPGVRSGAGPRAELGAGAGPRGRTRGRGPLGLSRCNVSHVWTIKNVTSVISRAPAQRQRPHLGPRRNGDGRISGPAQRRRPHLGPRRNGDGRISGPVQRRRLHLRSKRKRPRRTSRRGRTNRSVLQSAAIEDYSSL